MQHIYNPGVVFFIIDFYYMYLEVYAFIHV